MHEFEKYKPTQKYTQVQSEKDFLLIFNQTNFKPFEN